MNPQDKFVNFNNLINPKHEWQSEEIKIKFRYVEEGGCFSYKINEGKEEIFCVNRHKIDSDEKFLVIRSYADPMNILVRIQYKPPTSIVFELPGKSFKLDICD